MKNSEKSFISKYLSEDEIKVLFPIIAVAILIRLFYVIEIQGTFFMNYLTDDSKIYSDWAEKIANGQWTLKNPFFMAPAYPYFLGIIYTIFGKSLFLVQLIQIVFSIGTLFFTYLAARNFHSKTAGIIATVIGAFYINYIFYSGAILSETLQTFVYSVLIYHLSLSSKENDKFYYLKLGLILGLAAWFRGTILLFALLFSLYMLWKKNKFNAEGNTVFNKIGMFAVGTILMIAPITLHNYFAGDDFVLLTSNGGINFFVGNNERAVGVFVTPTEFDFYEDMPGHKYAQQVLRKKLKPSEASSYWYGRGLDWIKQNPADFVVLEIKKLLLFWGEDEDPQTSIMNPDYFAEHYSKILTLPLFGFFFLTFFAVPGIYFAFRKKYMNNSLFILLISFVLGIIIFFVNGRFRMAITPLMMIFAAGGIIEIYNLIKENKLAGLKIPVIVLAVFMMLYYFSFERPKFKPYDALLHMGNKAYEDKEYEKAIGFFKKSLFYRDYHLTYVNLGNSYAQLKDFRNAISAYNLAINRKPDYYLAHFNLGFAYTQMNKWDKAIEEYKVTLRYRPDFVDAYRNMGIVYYVNEKWEDALFYFRKYMTLSTDEETKELVRKDIETIELKLKTMGEK